MASTRRKIFSQAETSAAQECRTKTTKPIQEEFDPKLAHETRIGAANVEIQLILKGSSAQQKNSMQGMPQVWPLN